MRCPFCANTDTQVKDSRPTDEHTAIRRRRFCPECAGRFTTFERVQLRELNVIKKNGRKTPFNREKLLASLTIALRKRDIEEDRIERMVSSIVRRLESRGENDVPSETIGQMVMDGLKALDEVAYIRYASVYKDFHEAKEFGEIINKLSDDDE